MKFTPRSESELKTDFPLLEDGIYDVEVLTGEDTQSSKGNDMIKINLAVWVGDKVKCRIFDYLLTSHPICEAKLRHACDSFGLLDKYQAGMLEGNHFIGRLGKAKITKEPAKDGYDASNKIKDYVCKPAKPIATTQHRPNVVEDNLPF